MQKKIPVIAKLVRRLHECRSGLAAVEFAFIVPLMIILFFGVVESSDALSQNRRVSLAVNTLADLSAQETELLHSDVDALFDGVAQIAGADSADMTISLVSVIPDPDSGDPIVHWSRNNSGGEPYAQGAAYTKLPASTLLDPGASIIVAELVYPYSSALTSYVMSDIVTFDEAATRWPRRSTRVQLCSSVGNCTS